MIPIIYNVYNIIIIYYSDLYFNLTKNTNVGQSILLLLMYLFFYVDFFFLSYHKIHSMTNYLLNLCVNPLVTKLSSPRDMERKYILGEPQISHFPLKSFGY